MSAFRDARFEKALSHAPDVDAQAPAAVRAAIRTAAQRAVEPSPRPGWWQRLFPGGQRMPWNAALASVLVASFVTVLWRGGEQLPDEAVATAPPPAAVAQAPRADASAAVPREVARAPSSPPATPAPAPQAATRRAPPTSSGAAAVQERVVPAAPQVALPDARSKAAEAALAEGRDTARQQESSRAAAAAPSLGRAASPPAPIASPARQLESALGVREQSARSMPAWDAVRIESGSRAVVVPRLQAAALAAALGDVLAARGPVSADVPSGQSVALTFTDGSRIAATLMLREDTATWQVTGEAVTWRPDRATLDLLRAQALQLLQR